MAQQSWKKWLWILLGLWCLGVALIVLILLVKPPTGTHQNAQFNPRDVSETIQWLHTNNERERTHKPAGNNKFADSKKQVMAGVWEQPIGKEIEWVMRVGGVTETGMVMLESVSFSTEVDPSSAEQTKRKLTMVTTLAVVTQNNRGKTRDTTPFAWSGTIEELKMLRSGDSVKVSGKVQSLKREYLFGMSTGTHTCVLILDSAVVRAAK